MEDAEKALLISELPCRCGHFSKSQVQATLQRSSAPIKLLGAIVCSEEEISNVLNGMVHTRADEDIAGIVAHYDLLLGHLCQNNKRLCGSPITDTLHSGYWQLLIYLGARGIGIKQLLYTDESFSKRVNIILQANALSLVGTSSNVRQLLQRIRTEFIEAEICKIAETTAYILFSLYARSINQYKIEEAFPAFKILVNQQDYSFLDRVRLGIHWFDVFRLSISVADFPMIPLAWQPDRIDSLLRKTFGEGPLDMPFYQPHFMTERLLREHDKFYASCNWSMLWQICGFLRLTRQTAAENIDWALDECRRDLAASSMSVEVLAKDLLDPRSTLEWLKKLVDLASQHRVYLGVVHIIYDELVGLCFRRVIEEYIKTPAGKAHAARVEETSLALIPQDCRRSSQEAADPSTFSAE